MRSIVLGKTSASLKHGITRFKVTMRLSPCSLIVPAATTAADVYSMHVLADIVATSGARCLYKGGADAGILRSIRVVSNLSQSYINGFPPLAR